MFLPSPSSSSSSSVWRVGAKHEGLLLYDQWVLRLTLDSEHVTHSPTLTDGYVTLKRAACRPRALAEPIAARRGPTIFRKQERVC